ncbi:MAG TPA: alpha-L-fucosidase [Bacteroidales bacterium]|nr:alpha-L-fucosidase [Bacteroidales bacterium]HSA43006.1 alpha-L-fucosidase [Bacteroidales bacterium]
MRFPSNIIILILAIAGLHLQAQQKIHPDTIRGKMQWFADAKLGIFIHTGIYAVNGVSESWSFHNRRISHADYMKQTAGFTLRNYDPAAWAALIRESGARYAVITTKHHDGVAMYDTRMNALSIVKATPAGRDMIKPFFAELRKQGIKCGAYYSLIDWSHHDYPGFLKDSARYSVEKDSLRWERFRVFFRGQIDEIAGELKPDLWWFDGDWEHSARRWGADDVRKSILQTNPAAIINGRLQGFGDYDTPEQNFPVSRPPYHWWELCMTINDSWGYQPKDTHWKTPYEVITIFADVVSNGGNLLLDIGPREDGSIPEEQRSVLKALGNWNNKHAEAIFNTIPGLPPGHFYGPSTLSKDSTILYLFLAGNPREAVVIKGLFSEIENISLLGQNSPLAWKIVGKISWSPVPGLVYIEAPSAGHDQYMSVLRVKLKKPLRLYRGAGGLAL